MHDVPGALLGLYWSQAIVTVGAPQGQCIAAPCGVSWPVLEACPLHACIKARPRPNGPRGIYPEKQSVRHTLVHRPDKMDKRANYLPIPC